MASFAGFSALGLTLFSVLLVAFGGQLGTELAANIVMPSGIIVAVGMMWSALRPEAGAGL